MNSGQADALKTLFYWSKSNGRAAMGNHQADRPPVRFSAKTGSFKVLVHENK
jgi:hypothetical protein